VAANVVEYLLFVRDVDASVTAVRPRNASSGLERNSSGSAIVSLFINRTLLTKISHKLSGE
jgi:hypothetical protein